MSRYNDEYKADAVAQLVADGYPDNAAAPDKVRQVLLDRYGYAPVVNTLKRWFTKHDADNVIRLTEKQRVFVEAYLECWNGAEAARRAGYSERSARVLAYETLTKPYVQEYIQQRLNEMKMSADESLVLLAKMARASFEDFVDIPEPTPDEDGELSAPIPLPNFVKAQERGQLDLVKEMTWNKGRFSFKLYDKQSAVNTIAKHHGLLKDHIEIDVNLVIAVIDALQALEQDPVKVFNEIIARAAAKKNANS